MRVLLLLAGLALTIYAVIDCFQTDDERVKYLPRFAWVVLIVIIPWLGALVYLIARGRSMNERALAQAQHQDHAFRQYVQDAAGSPASTADELAKLAKLRDQGAISEQEFAQAKARLLGAEPPASTVPPANRREPVG